jgi:hypothetical protein
MFKFVLSLTFAVSYATAATIITTATCDGVTTVGAAMAMCNDVRSFASAEVGGSLQDLTVGSFTSFTVNVDAGPGVGLPSSAVASASASFSEDAVFTVSGGTGTGFFYPCVFVTSHNGGSASIVFGTFSGPCLPPGSTFLGEQPFTFGVPQIVQITAQGSEPGASFREDSASATLGPILFLDSSGNLLPNVTYTLVDSVPEPSSLFLLGIGLMFFLGAVWRISRGAPRLAILGVTAASAQTILRRFAVRQWTPK